VSPNSPMSREPASYTKHGWLLKTKKVILRKLVHSIAGFGEQSLGAIEFYLRPSVRTSWGGPFNGQHARRFLIDEILSVIRFAAIIETGTFRGTTTEYLHKSSGLPVYTVELKRRYYGYAKARFAFNSAVRVYYEDSRRFLRRIAEDAEYLKKQNVLFYLDAHWGGDPPLKEELQVIFGKFDNAVVMIDDFKVPHDGEYAYDVYGKGAALTLEYLSPLTTITGFSAFFPKCKAAQETGLRRGCVVLARAHHLVDQLKEVKTLLLNAE